MTMANESFLAIIFRVSNNFFLISSEYVSDITPIPNATTIVPNAPAYCSKLCNSYGRSIAILDLSMLLSLSPDTSGSTDTSMLIIINGDQNIGLLVSQIVAVKPLEHFHSTKENPFAGDFIRKLYTPNVSNGLPNILFELDIPHLLHHHLSLF